MNTSVEPYKESQRPRKDKALEAIVRRFMRIQVLFDTKEQQKVRDTSRAGVQMSNC